MSEIEKDCLTEVKIKVFICRFHRVRKLRIYEPPQYDQKA